ncbi:MAG TPA: MOSC N-terminal beta barrel domain-containing protein [Acidimicrobiales bacterium]|nr:MOSC N-terminal beta barrel domain-containing protein [Acidimicrobiales bacterium]
MRQVGVVVGLRRYPVKSMLGEGLSSAALDERGLVGDRAFALVDEETGKVVSVKRPRWWGRIFELGAATDADGQVRVTLPEGTVRAVDDADLPDLLSDFFGRRVSIVRAAPPGASFDEVWERDLKDGAEPYFGGASRVEDGDEMVDGGSEMSAHGNLFNDGTLHVLTTSSTEALARAAPGSAFAPHRFRPNVVVETPGDGFVETAWQGHDLTVGDGVRLAVTFTVPRCVMTTLQQGDQPADRDVLRTIARENAVDVLGTGTRYPCLGVYADVGRAGRIEVGDPVLLD